MQDLTGKRYIVLGVAADSSIAWAIAKELGARGATVTLGYQKRFLSRIMQLVKDQPFIEAYKECDVSLDDSTKAFFGGLEGQFDGLVHAIAFAPAEALNASIVETNEEDFCKTMVVSSYSLVRVIRHALPKLKAGSSTITLSYLGAERVVPGYRIMGTAKAALESLVRELAMAVGPMDHRVNAISAGPVKTLAASGVPGFDMILDWMRTNTPLRRNITQQDVAKTAAFLLAEDSAGITGQTLYVDAGYNIVGAPPDLDRVLVEPRAGIPSTPL
ncbi:MAG TPA: enoyl-ACP reductase [Candidatus Thermoplasmatota archaeon]|nr:enoyl-ACP reductase [Candidatus Thermoplasmatota archaeon]